MTNTTPQNSWRAWFRAISFPDLTANSPTDAFQSNKQRAMAASIGAIACFLAFFVARVDVAFQDSCARLSISHYFYEPMAGTLMVMSLTFAGAFMIAYEGRAKLDAWVAFFGGCGALVLAFFPTDGLGCPVGTVADFRPSLIFEVPTVFADGAKPETFAVTATTARIASGYSQTLHFAGAGVLFLSLLYFTAFAFVRVNHVKDLRTYDPKTDIRQDKTRCKRIRNAFYVVLSALIAFGILVVLANETQIAKDTSVWLGKMIAKIPGTPSEAAGYPRPVYHGELIALGAFGLAWLLHGRLIFAALKFLYGPDSDLVKRIEELEVLIRCRPRDTEPAVAQA